MSQPSAPDVRPIFSVMLSWRARSFYNLFNCSASRFTDEHIAMTYLTKTDYGLATTGTTKPGGNYYPKAFHHLLAQGNTWGEAFRGWYNNFGVTDDKWFLGMVILGDPMLTIQPTVHRILKTAPLTQIPPDEEMMDARRAYPEEMPVEQRVNSFDEIVPVLTKDEAMREARRCLRCDLS